MAKRFKNILLLRCDLRFGVEQLVLTVLLVCLVGCGNPYRELPFAGVISDSAPLSVHYRISAGDLLEVKYPYRPEFNETLRVRPDGYVSVPFVGELRAAGFTPAELETLLKTHFGGLGGTDGSARRYLLSPNDVLSVVFPFNPEFNQAEVVVRPDGRISLPLVGSFVVDSLTPEQLQEALVDAYAKQLRKPPAISVIVNSFSSNRFVLDDVSYPGEVADLKELLVVVQEAQPIEVFVSGEVATPRQIAYFPGMTVRQAIIAAGGVTDSADTENVLLLTKPNGKEGRVVRVNLDSSLESGLLSTAQLRPFDVVLVPKSGIARLNLWMRQHLYDLVPFIGNSSFSFTYEIDPVETVSTEIR